MRKHPKSRGRYMLDLMGYGLEGLGFIGFGFRASDFGVLGSETLNP